MEEKKKLSKTTIYRISVIICLLMVIFALVFILFKDNSKNNDIKKGSVTTESTTTSSTTQTPGTAVMIDVDKVGYKVEDDTERTSKVEVLNKFYYHRDNSKYSSFKVVGKNNNDHYINVTFYLNFYKNGQRVNSELGSAVNVKANKKFVVDISVDYADEYDSVDISCTTQKGKSVYTDLDISKDLFVFEEKSLYSSKNIYYNYDVEDKDNKVLYAYLIYRKDGKEVFAENAIYMNGGFKFFPSSYNVDYDDLEFDVYSAYLKSSNY